MREFMEMINTVDASVEIGKKEILQYECDIHHLVKGYPNDSEKYIYIETVKNGGTVTVTFRKGMDTPAPAEETERLVSLLYGIDRGKTMERFMGYLVEIAIPNFVNGIPTRDFIA